MRAVVLLAVCIFAAPWVSAAEHAHAIRQGTQGLACVAGVASAAFEHCVSPELR